MVKKLKKKDFPHFGVLGRQKYPYVGGILKKSHQSQLYTYRQIEENVKKCWRNERNEKCIDGISVNRLANHFSRVARRSVFSQNVKDDDTTRNIFVNHYTFIRNFV